MVGDGLGLVDGTGVAGAADFGAGVGIGAAVCQVVRPGGGVGVGVGDPDGGGLDPSALAGEARSQASSPIAKVMVRTGPPNTVWSGCPKTLIHRSPERQAGRP